MPTVTSTFNAADQLTATAYTYDANGNQLTAGTRSFTYDLANRLKTTTASGTTTYAYDGDGVRQQTSTGTAASAKTNFVSGGDGRPSYDPLARVIHRS